MALGLLLATIAAANTAALLLLGRDLCRRWAEVRQDAGPWPLQLLSSFGLYFLSAFGISDFALSTVLYTKTRWAASRKLPGTLNTQGLVAVTIMALAYLSSVQIALSTLLPYIFLQALGSWVGPRVSVRLRVSTLKLAMAVSLLLAGALMLASRLGWLRMGGAAMGLVGWKLPLLLAASFGLGFLKTLGVGSYPLTMALVFLLGLNPLAAYPLMMGGSALSLPVAATQFIKLDAYSRRLAFCSCTAGALGALLAVFVVKSLDVTLLQWVMLAVMFLASAEMFMAGYRLRVRGE